MGKHVCLPTWNNTRLYTMTEPIDGRRAEQFALEGLSPFFKVQIAGDDRRAQFVAFGHHVVELLLLVQDQRLEAEIVND